MTSEGTLRLYGMMADAMAPRQSDFFGLQDPSVAGLRAFIAYHKNARQPVELAGRTRMLSHKQVAMHGLVTRLSVTGEHGTVRQLAKEANVAPSTLSRFLLKLQVWNVFAIDVTRGRHGGVTVRLRAVRDGLQAYAHRAWAKVRSAAEKAFSRSRGNVASVPSLEEGTYNTADNDLASTYLLMDATFNEAWDVAERGRARVLADEGSPEPTFALPGQGRTPDQAWAEAEAFAAAVIAERRRLAIIDPAGEADAVRPLW